MPEQPVKAKAGGPFTCKTCTGKKYFGILVEYDKPAPRCPNCKGPTSPARATDERQ